MSSNIDPNWVPNIEDLNMDDDDNVVFFNLPNRDRSCPFDGDAVVHLTEDPNTAATTGDCIISFIGLDPSTYTIPGDATAIHLCDSEFPDEYFIRELITGTGEVDLASIFEFFPNYQPMFMEAPHLNHVLPFVCENRCFLRNWLAIRHRLHRRFFGGFMSFYGHSIPFSADTVRQTLVEMTGFFAFATIPFFTEEMPKKEMIGHAACLLRANLATLELVWQFYEEPLSGEIRAALRLNRPGEEPSDQDINGFTGIVQHVFLGHRLEPNRDFIEPGDVAVCFDIQNPVHAREISRYWQVKLNGQLYQKLQTLGPWTGSCGNGNMELDVVLPDIYATELNYDLPRIRDYTADDGAAPVPIDTCIAIASTIGAHLQGCSTAALFGSFALDEPEAPRQASYGANLL